MYHNGGTRPSTAASATLRRLRRPRRSVHRAARGRDGHGGHLQVVGEFGIDGFRIDTVKHVNLEFLQKFFQRSELWPRPRATRVLHVRRGLRRQSAETSGSRRRPVPGDVGLRVPAQATSDFAQGQPDHRAEGPVREGRLLHRCRSQRVFRADVPRESRHGAPRRSCRLTAERGRVAASGLAGSLVDVSRAGTRSSITATSRASSEAATGSAMPGEDMFTSQVTTTTTDGPRGHRGVTAADQYEPGHPLYRYVAALSALREKQPALADGAQIAPVRVVVTGIFASPYRPVTAGGVRRRGNNSSDGEHERHLRHLVRRRGTRALCGRAPTAGRPAREARSP